MSDASPGDLEEQSQALRERVLASGLYLHEIEEFSVARATYARVAQRVGVLADLGSLATPESRNIVRKVHLTDGSSAVLKVIGNVREPGEGEVLDAWRKVGLPCVGALDWGYERVRLHGQTRHTSWLLTEFLPLPPMHLGDGLDAAGRVATVQRLVRFMRRFHFSKATVTSARSWAERVNLHLRWTLPLIRRHDLAEPEGWTTKLAAACRRGNALVHGDPAGKNVLVTKEGSYVLLDPPGALLAPREADIAQIASYVGCAGARGAAEKAADVAVLIQQALEADQTLNPAMAALFAGINLFTWSGYFLANHCGPYTQQSCGDDLENPAIAESNAKAYLAVARELVAEFEID